MIVRRRLGQHREIGHFGQGQRVDRLVEIGLRRRLHPISVPPEEDLVEVELDDLFLGERILDALRQDRLAALAQIGDLVGQQQVLRHLLGDRRGADRAAAVGEVGEHRLRNARIVEPAVREEGLVLGRDEGVDQRARQFLERHEHPALAREGVDRRSVDRADVRRQRRLIVGEVGGARQAVGEEEVEHEPGDQPEPEQPERRAAGHPRPTRQPRDPRPPVAHPPQPNRPTRYPLTHGLAV